jgi:hypothetical protein
MLFGETGLLKALDSYFDNYSCFANKYITPTPFKTKLVVKLKLLIEVEMGQF